MLRIGGADVIRRRHVIYVEGYDPQGAKGYYRMFERGFARFLKIWPLQAQLGPLELESQDFARWNIEAAGPNWQVATRYDFLRQEHIIRANMNEPLWRQIPSALGLGSRLRRQRSHLSRAARVGIFRRGAALFPEHAAAVAWRIARRRMADRAPGGALWRACRCSSPFLSGLPPPWRSLLLLRRLADRWFVIQINNHWPHLCAFARGEPTCFDPPVEACAQRLIAAVSANEADEIVVIGHSGGGALAPAVMVRALELDPEVGRRGPPVVLLTLGSIAPGAALHPRAEKLRALFARLAVEPSVRWIDCQTRLDVMNFWDFDPVEGIGVQAGPQRCNPLVWNLRLRDMLADDFVNRNRINFFRLHYQFIMANDHRAAYDYFMLVCGPLPVATWATRKRAALAAFAEDATLSAGQSGI